MAAEGHETRLAPTSLAMTSPRAQDAAPVSRAHRMPFGAEWRNGRVRFRLWAPSHAVVHLQLGPPAGSIVLRRAGGGWHALVTDRARPGSRYRFVLPDGQALADPGSRYQPEDVHGASEVVDPSAYGWADAGWRGRPWPEAVLYEL